MNLQDVLSKRGEEALMEVGKVPITAQMIRSCKLAHSRYHQHLKTLKEEQELTEAERRKEAVKEDVYNLQAKLKKLDRMIKAYYKVSP